MRWPGSPDADPDAIVTGLIGWVRALRDYPRGVWVLLAGVLLLRAGAMVAPFMTLFLTGPRGHGPEVAGFVVAAYGLGSVLGALGGGWAADRWGRKPAMLVSLFGTALLFPLAPFLDSLWLLVPLLFGVGFLSGIYSPAALAALADMVPEARRVAVYGLNYWVANIGSALAPILGGVLVLHGYGTLFFANAGAYAVFGIGLLLLFAAPPRLPPAGPGTGRAASAWGVLRDPVVWTVAGGNAITSILFFQSYGMLPLEMQADGLGPTAYGLAIALNGAVVVALSLPVSHWVARFDPRVVLAVGALLFGGGMLLTGAASTLPQYAATVVIWTLGEILIAPVAPALLAAAAPPGRRALYQGTLTGAWGWATLAGPVLGGSLFAIDPWLLWGVCGALGVLAAAIFACTPSPDRSHRARRDSGQATPSVPD